MYGGWRTCPFPLKALDLADWSPPPAAPPNHNTPVAANPALPDPVQQYGELVHTGQRTHVRLPPCSLCDQAARVAAPALQTR